MITDARRSSTSSFECCVSSHLYRAVASILRLGVLNKAVASAEGASRIEAPKAPRGVRCGKGVSPSPQKEESGEGAVKFFDILESK